MIERTDFEQWRSKEVARLLALVESERRYYQDLVSALPVPLAILGPDGAIAWANRAFRRLFKVTAEELRRKEIDDLLPVEGLEAFIDQARGQNASPEPLPVEVHGQAGRLTALAVRNWDDDREETLLVLELGEIAVEEPVIEAPPPPLVPADLPAIVWTADGDSTDFRTVAGAAEEFLGYPLSHWLNRAGFFEERIHPDDREPVMALYRSLLEGGGDGSAEFRAVTASGELFWCRESIRVASVGGAPPTMTGVLTNISRRKQLEQQLLSGARLDGLQAMAGRLAHDLNNPLMIIHGYGEEMVQALGPTNPLRADAGEILTASQRISAIAAKLTDLSHKPASQAQTVQLTELLETMRPTLAQAAGDRVTLEMTDAPGAISATADAAQLVEVILTLANGEREAAKGRTRLTVSVGVDRVPEQVMAEFRPGRYASLQLRDDGLGMDAAKLAGVFDPNVNPMKADGLAMARAHGLVRQWGGDIACTSQPNRGTAFTILLPLVEFKPAKTAELPAALREVPTAVPAAAPELAPVVVPEPEPEPVRETVLVVDDEAGIRGLMRKILRRERYEVLEAATAEEALRLAAEHPEKIHLLLTDVMLPGMLGPELAKKLYAKDHTLKVLYISGFTQDESVRTGDDPPGSKFLAKPFTLGSLLEKVRETLGE